MTRFRKRPSPATVIACLALAVALGGTSYAAIRLPANSVTTRQVKNYSLLKRDFKRRQLPRGPRGISGPPGAQGKQGIQGTQGTPGPRGPSDVYSAYVPMFPPKAPGIVSVTVPAGDYAVTGEATATNINQNGVQPERGFVNCDLSTPADPGYGGDASATVPNNGLVNGMTIGGAQEFALSSSFHLPNGGTITEDCRPAGASSPNANLQFTAVQIQAIQVGTLHR